MGCFACSHAVRYVSPDGFMTLVAGTGVAGFSGNGGPATLAQLNNPAGIVADGAGGAWIAEYSNHVIRRIQSDGMISAVAGNRTATYNGDNIAAVNARCDILWWSCHAPVTPRLRMLCLPSQSIISCWHDFGRQWRNHFHRLGGALATENRCPCCVQRLACLLLQNCIIRQINAAGIISLLAGIPALCGVSCGGLISCGLFLHPVARCHALAPTDHRGWRPCHSGPHRHQWHARH